MKIKFTFENTLAIFWIGSVGMDGLFCLLNKNDLILPQYDELLLQYTGFHRKTTRKMSL